MEKLEDVIADRHSATRGWEYLQSSNYPPERPVPSDPDFSRSVEFDESGPDLRSPGEGYVTVTVTVEWVNPDGRPDSLAIATVLTGYGP